MEVNKESIPRISSNDKGSLQLWTLKIKGLVENKDARILVDYGSTHIFIDIDIVKRLNLFFCPVKVLTIMVVDDQGVIGVGKCQLWW